MSNYRIYAGHSHIRDCQQYDGRSIALESGRYMETIGSLVTSRIGWLNLSFYRLDECVPGSSTVMSATEAS